MDEGLRPADPIERKETRVVWILISAFAVALMAAIWYLSGARGPLLILLASLPVLAGLLAGARSARRAAVAVAVLYLAMATLEWMGVWQPREMSAQIARVANGLALMISLVSVSLLLNRFLDSADSALHLAEERDQELAEASERAREAVQAEREARDREQLAASQLRQAVAQYVAFLERVSSGDYEERLDLDRVALGKHAEELRILGKYLNATVESLVKGVTEMQDIQRRYLGEAWEGYIHGGAVQRKFRYLRHPEESLGVQAHSDEEAWFPSMTEAVVGRKAVIRDTDLAIPVTWGGTVLGAIGARRQHGHGWNDEDSAMVSVVVEQLAQTIENLRLLEETQRNADREQMIGEVTSRVRESLDLETMLKRAAEEMRRALGLDRVLVRLSTVDGASDRSQSGQDAY